MQNSTKVFISRLLLSASNLWQRLPVEIQNLSDEKKYWLKQPLVLLNRPIQQLESELNELGMSVLNSPRPHNACSNFLLNDCFCSEA